jgi:hypothetical protein
MIWEYLASVFGKSTKDTQMDDLAAELERADKEIRSLQALVETLKKDDLAAEAAKWRLAFDRLDGRLQQEMQLRAEAEKKLKYARKRLEEVLCKK